MKVLFASSEIFPHAKSGGLSDVSYALPQSLKKDSKLDVSCVMPRYSFMDKKRFKKFIDFELSLAHETYHVTILKQEKNGIETYFVDTPLLSETLGMYGDADGDYANNDLRFGIFCSAIVELARYLSCDVLHLNDWHTALAALFVKELNLTIKTVFTIHNLAYQGIFPYESLERLGIDAKHFHINGLEFYGRVNFLKAGIAWSDHVTTVSPSYAQEIQGQTYGCGLDGFLHYHAAKLTGILNGINQEYFNPRKDSLIPFGFDENSLDLKHKNKVAFMKTTTLKDPRKPLFVMISRLVEQKGIGLVIDVIDTLLAEKINLYIVGEGAGEYVQKLETLATQYDNFYFHEGYDEAISHQAYAAADFLLMPSKFEPCGLNQFIAMRYGAVPITHCVGGLKDSVSEESQACGKGFVFDAYTQEDFINAFQRALAFKKESKKFKTLVCGNMQCDFSFTPHAKEYSELYKSLL